MVEGRGRGGRQGEQRIGPGAVVGVPVLEEDRHIGPGPLVITHRQRVLGVGADHLAGVLRGVVPVDDHLPELDEDGVGLLQLTPPDPKPGLQQPKVRGVVGRRVKLERALDHRVRRLPLAEGDHRLGGVAGQHRPDRPLQALTPGQLDAGQGLVDGVLVTTGEVQHVGVVDEVAQLDLGVAAGQVAGQVVLSEPGRLLPDGRQAGAQGVVHVGQQPVDRAPRARRDAVGGLALRHACGLLRGLGRLIGHLDATRDLTREHHPLGQVVEHPPAQDG